MSAVGAISTLVWVLIAIVIIVIILVVLFKVINLLFIAYTPMVSATFPAYTETGRAFPLSEGFVASLTPIPKV